MRNLCVIKLISLSLNITTFFTEIYQLYAKMCHYAVTRRNHCFVNHLERVFIFNNKLTQEFQNVQSP